MNDTDSAPVSLATWGGWLTRRRHVALVDRLTDRIRALSPSDRLLFYSLAAIVCATSLAGLYAIEQSLLIVEPAYGGSITEGVTGSPRFINPLLAISDADRDLTQLTYAGLMGLSGSGTLVPVLASGYTLSDDGKTYTFTLRKDLKFSDGSPVTASDVVFTVNKAQDPALKSPEYADWTGVQVVALDPHTVQFTLSKPYAPFLGLTTLGILPAHLWQSISNEEFPFANYETNPVGAGPFNISTVSRGSTGLIESISLTANPDYALGRPYLDNMRFAFYAQSDDLVSALGNGSVDSAYDVPTVRAASQTVVAPYARVFGVFWNQSENQVYTRTEVRKALSLALDRTAIIDTVLGGYATPILGPVPPDNTVVQVPIPQTSDPIATAAQILKDGGWAYDGTARLWKNVAAKQTLDGITISTSNVPELKSVATAVKETWEKLGIPVTIELYEPGDLSQNIIRPRKYEALLYGMVIGRNEDLYAFWDSQERNDPGLNIALYANKTVDAYLEDARSSGDEKSRIADLQKIENTVAAEYPAAFIYAPDFTYAVPADLSGVLIPEVVTPADRFANVAFWYRATDAVWPFLAHERPHPE